MAVPREPVARVSRANARVLSPWPLILSFRGLRPCWLKPDHAKVAARVASPVRNPARRRQRRRRATSASLSPAHRLPMNQSSAPPSSNDSQRIAGPGPSAAEPRFRIGALFLGFVSLHRSRPRRVDRTGRAMSRSHPASTLAAARASLSRETGKPRPCGFIAVEADRCSPACGDCEKGLVKPRHPLLTRRFAKASGRSMEDVSSPVSGGHENSCERLTCHARLHQSVRRPPRVMRRGNLLSFATFRYPRLRTARPCRSSIPAMACNGSGAAAPMGFERLFAGLIPPPGGRCVSAMPGPRAVGPPLVLPAVFAG